MIENIVIKSSHWLTSDIGTLFGCDSDTEERESVVFIDANDLPSLLRDLGCYASATQARKAGRAGPIPPGFTANFKATKKRRLWIWNPTE